MFLADFFFIHIDTEIISTKLGVVLILAVSSSPRVKGQTAVSPAGQDPDHVVGFVAFDADGAVVEVGLRLLVALPDGAHLKLTDGLLRRVAKTPLRTGVQG